MVVEADFFGQYLVAIYIVLVAFLLCTTFHIDCGNPLVVAVIVVAVLVGVLVVAPVINRFIATVCERIIEVIEKRAGKVE